MVDLFHTDSQFTTTHKRTDQGTQQLKTLAPLLDDDLSTRLFASVVEVVEDRRHLISSLGEHKHYLNDAEHTIEELKDEKRAIQLIMTRKEEEIENGRRQSAEKQLKYDQLLEDYKQLRTSDAKEYERLQQQIKEIRLNYENLNVDYSRFRTESSREAEKLEAEARDGLVKYHQLLEAHNRLREENTNLMANIVAFTQQMSSIKFPERIMDSGFNPIPIHPVVKDDSENATES